MSETPPWSSAPHPVRLAPGDSAHVLERVFATLDRLVHGCVADRLVAAATLLAPDLDTARWWVGHVGRDGALSRSASGVRREGDDGATLTDVLGRPRARWEDPRTRPMLEGSSFALWAGGLARGRRRAARLGRRRHGRGGRRLRPRRTPVDPVVLGDARTVDLRDAQPLLVAVVQASLGFPRRPRGR